MNIEITIGATVKRVPGDRWSEGETGQVIEIDNAAGRARVFWTEKLNYYTKAIEKMRKPRRTWVKLTSLGIAR